MTISLPGKGCHETILAQDEDDLVRQVQAHARDHGGAPGRQVPSREQILAHRGDRGSSPERAV